LSKPNPPSKPKNRLLPDWIDSYIEFTKDSEPPALFKYWSGIATISAALQRKCYLSWGAEGRLYPNMYIILCGPSASRKGTAMKRAGNLLDILEEKGSITRAPNSCSRERLIEIMAGASRDIETEKHCSLTIYATELTVFINRHTDTMLSDLNEWFDCLKCFKYSTKHQGENTVLNVWVSLFGATTPDHINRDLPSAAMTGGFNSRVIFVFGDRRSKKVALPVICSKLDTLGERLAFDLDIINSLEGEFKMTEGYLNTYQDWYDNKMDDDHNLDLSKFEGYIGRRADHVRKLSIIFCASSGNGMVLESEHFIRAKMLLLYTEKYMPFVFKGQGRCEGSDIVSDIMLRADNFRRAYQEGKIQGIEELWVYAEDVYQKFVLDAVWDEVVTYMKSVGQLKDYEADCVWL